MGTYQFHTMLLLHGSDDQPQIYPKIYWSLPVPVNKPKTSLKKQ